MPLENLLGLPPVPPDLKPILPYLQRADEVQRTDPVIAYWCSYYATQTGISLKVKDKNSKNFLHELLGKLETMKHTIGPHDAVDVQAASAAYVENFGLRVFGLADDEDRKGMANKSTAKKFLAAAHFLEVLKIFPKADVYEPNLEKIKYAKWKAADIAKAFREGRKPTPGPPGGLDPDPAEPVSQDVFGSAAPSAQILPNAQTYQPPPPQIPSLPLQGNSQAQFQTPPRQNHLFLPDVGEPGTWSTAATPGNDVPFMTPGISQAGANFSPPESPTARRDIPHRKDGSVGSTGSSPPKTVRFASTTSGSPTGSVGGHSPPRNVPSMGYGPPPPTVHINGHERHPSGSSLPNIYAPPAIPPPPPEMYNPSPSIYAAPIVPSPPNSTYNAPLAPSPNSIYAPPPASTSPPKPSIYAPSAPPAPVVPQYQEPVPVEVSPAVIKSAQKHCRFAISALDYDDLETARKELRAALQTIGG